MEQKTLQTVNLVKSNIYRRAVTTIVESNRFYKINYHSEIPTCTCGRLAKPILENTGFIEPDGPGHDEVIGYECPIHGKLI